MSGVTVQLRTRRRENARPWPDRLTKAEHAKHFRGAALSLLRYADNPDAAASALACLDHAEQLEVSPRCGWYPRRPAGWRP